MKERDWKDIEVFFEGVWAALNMVKCTMALGVGAEEAVELMEKAMLMSEAQVRKDAREKWGREAARN